MLEETCRPNYSYNKTWTESINSLVVQYMFVFLGLIISDNMCEKYASERLQYRGIRLSSCLKHSCLPDRAYNFISNLLSHLCMIYQCCNVSYFSQWTLLSHICAQVRIFCVTYNGMVCVFTHACVHMQAYIYIKINQLALYPDKWTLDSYYIRI